MPHIDIAAVSIVCSQLEHHARNLRELLACGAQLVDIGNANRVVAGRIHANGQVEAGPDLREHGQRVMNQGMQHMGNLLTACAAIQQLAKGGESPPQQGGSLVVEN